MLQEAIEAEVGDFIKRHKPLKNEEGKQRVVRNGHQDPRIILTGAGPLKVVRPRVRDRKNGIEERIRFEPQILPLYLRRSKNIDELIPWLYLKGISTGDFSEALPAILGPNAKNLSKAHSGSPEVAVDERLRGLEQG
jgi:putative transposase